MGNDAVKGFTPVNKDIIKRVIMAVDGVEKHGKTTFALTAPGPIAIINMDIGLEGVVSKFPDKVIYEAVFNYRDVTNKDEWEQMWLKVKEAWINALHSPTIRTVVADTATEMWELCRLARLGRLTQIKPMHYGPVNAEFRDLIRESYDCGKNVILLHKQKREYIDDKATGRLERSGFGDTGYLVQCNVNVWRREGNVYGLTVRDCRQNSDINEQEFEDPMNTFPFLASSIFPEVDMEYWEDGTTT